MAALLSTTPRQSSSPPRDAAEDLRRWQRWKGGDAAVRDELVTRYAPLVKYVVGRMPGRPPAPLDYDDLLSIGTIGLLQAMDRFDLTQGVQFETFAIPRIRGAIVDAIREQSPLSRTVTRRARAVEEAMAVLASELGRHPTLDETAARLQIARADLDRVLEEIGWSVVSLDAAHTVDNRANGSEGGRSLEEVLSDPSDQTAQELAERQEDLQLLADCIRQLNEREQLVLSLYYQEELTLKEIGKVLDVSESRVSQIHTAAELKLRARMKAARKENS